MCHTICVIVNSKPACLFDDWFYYYTIKFSATNLCWITIPIDNWLDDVCTSRDKITKWLQCAMAHRINKEIHTFQFAFYKACTLVLLLLFASPLLNFNEEIWTRTFIYINLLSLSFVLTLTFIHHTQPLLVFYYSNW